MKRDWDMIRDLLTSLEELPNTDATLRPTNFPDGREFEISYHMELLIEAGLVDGKLYKTLDGGPTEFIARRLTWSGHEFLDAVRSDTVWAKTKRTFSSKGLDMTFDLIKSVASEITVALVRGTAGI